MSDAELAEMIAKFRTPSGMTWEPLRDDVLTALTSCRNEERKRLSDPMRRKIAEIIHTAWAVDEFDPDRDTEDWAAADAVLAAFVLREVKPS